MRLNVTKGQQFTKAEANALLRVEREFSRQRKQTSGSKQDLALADSQTFAWTRNATGADLSWGEIVGIDFDTPLISPDYSAFLDALGLRGLMPTSADHHSGGFGVTLDPIPDGEVGRVVVAGACRCKLSVTNAADNYADVTNNSKAYLTTGAGGPARILYKPTGTGALTGIVRLGAVYPDVLGKADTAIANAASGTVRVYAGTPGSETDTTQTITSCYNRGPAIADEAWVTVSWLHGKPYVWLVNCE